MIPCPLHQSVFMTSNQRLAGIDDSLVNAQLARYRRDPLFHRYYHREMTAADLGIGEGVNSTPYSFWLGREAA